MQQGEQTITNIANVMAVIEIFYQQIKGAPNLAISVQFKLSILAHKVYTDI